MDGVTTLNTIYEYGTNFSTCWIFIALAVFLTCFGLLLFPNKSDKATVILTIATILCFGIMIILGRSIKEDKSKLISTTYQVTIDEEVNFVEFYKKYEIIDQEGQIYTIKEKE